VRELNTVYEVAKDSVVSTGGCIVRVNTPTAESFYASNFAFRSLAGGGLNAGQLQPVLKSISPFTERLDWETRRLSFPSTTIKLMNISVADIVSNTMVKPLDQVVNADGNIWEHANSVDIYLAVGEFASVSVTTWLLKFSGPITDIQITPATITIKASSWGKAYNHTILTDKIEDLPAAEVPTDNKGEFVPELWGIWNENFNRDNYFAGNSLGDRDDPFAGNGLAKAIAYKTIDGFFSYVIANTAINSVGSVYLSLNDCPIPAINETSSGTVVGPVVVDTSAGYGYAYFPLIAYAEGDVWPAYSGAPVKNYRVPSADSATDGLLNTYLRIYDGEDFGGNVFGWAPFYFAQDVLFRKTLLAAPGSNRYMQAGIYNAHQDVSGDVGVSPLATLYFGTDGTATGYIGQQGRFGDVAWDQTSWEWCIIQGQNAFEVDPDNGEYYSPAMLLWVVVIAAGDDIPENQLVWRAYEFQARILLSPPEQPTICYAAAEGRLYGSWIESPSSRWNNLSLPHHGPGDVIVSSAGIIEDILRNYADIAPPIDTNRFDECYDVVISLGPDGLYCKHPVHIQLHSDNNLTINQTIQQLSEQSTFAFQWDARGVARCINLLHAGWLSATTSRTIHFTHIKDGDITIGKTPIYANRLVVNCRYHQEKDIYRVQFQLNDVESQALYGIIAAEVHWPNISARYNPTDIPPWQGAAYIGRMLVGDPDLAQTDEGWGEGLWSRPHNYVKFTALGFTNTDLEVGDHITFDHESCDPHLKIYGDTWENTHFMITELRHGCAPDVYTQVTAVQLST